MDASRTEPRPPADEPVQAPPKLSELLGKWKYAGDAVMCSKPFAGQSRLDDLSALHYGGPYMVGESISATTGDFLQYLPLFVATVEQAAEHSCTCGGEDCCASCVARRALDAWCSILKQDNAF